MLTYSKKTDIQSVITFLLKEQKTGILSVKIPVYNTSVELPKNKNRFLLKNLFFYSGTITYAFEFNKIPFSVLKDYLTYYQIESKIDEYFTKSKVYNNTAIKEYDCLIWLLQKKYLKPQQLKNILSKIIEENIFELFISQQGKAKFQEHCILEPVCYSKIDTETIYRLNNMAKKWQQFRPLIVSPHEYLLLKNKTFLKENVSIETYDNISCWSNNKKTLIELSRQLNCSLIDICQALYPYIQKKLISLETNY